MKTIIKYNLRNEPRPWGLYFQTAGSSFVQNFLLGLITLFGFTLVTKYMFTLLELAQYNILVSIVSTILNMFLIKTYHNKTKSFVDFFIAILFSVMIFTIHVNLFNDINTLFCFFNSLGITIISPIELGQKLAQFFGAKNYATVGGGTGTVGGSIGTVGEGTRTVGGGTANYMLAKDFPERSTEGESSTRCTMTITKKAIGLAPGVPLPDGVTNPSASLPAPVPHLIRESFPARNIRDLGTLYETYWESRESYFKAYKEYLYITNRLEKAMEEGYHPSARSFLSGATHTPNDAVLDREDLIDYYSLGNSPEQKFKDNEYKAYLLHARYLHYRDSIEAHRLVKVPFKEGYNEKFSEIIAEGKIKGDEVIKKKGIYTAVIEYHNNNNITWDSRRFYDEFTQTYKLIDKNRGKN